MYVKISLFHIGIELSCCKPPLFTRKEMDNDEIFNLVLILFPEQKVLKKLVEYFKQQNKTIYQQLASKLAARLLSLR
ncbi:restriction endonuclease [Helicobacter pylori]|nr:restriction endonuclease [Helicobacter pylori]